MGLFDQATNTQDLEATLLTAGFQATGVLNVIGVLQTFINDERKNVFALREAQLYGVVQGNPAASMRVPELYLRKDECHVVVFGERFPGEQTGLMPRAERLAVYTSHYVIQGDFYMGTDALLSDFIHSSKSPFVAATNVAIFPLFPAQVAVVQQAPLAYVHQASVCMHHAL